MCYVSYMSITIDFFISNDISIETKQFQRNTRTRILTRQTAKNEKYM